MGSYSTSNGDVNDSATVTGNFDFGYGFPKDQDGDFTTILDKVLTRISGNVGTITSLSDINPGNNYNFDPFVSVYSPGIARYNRRDLVLKNLFENNYINKKKYDGEYKYKQFKKAIEIYKNLYPALVRNKMFYDSIINGQNMLKEAVIEYNDYITDPQYAFSSLFNNNNEIIYFEIKLQEFIIKFNKN